MAGCGNLSRHQEGEPTLSHTKEEDDVEFIQVPRYKLLAWLEEIKELRRLASKRTSPHPAQD